MWYKRIVVNLDIVSELPVPVLLGTTYIDNRNKSIQPAAQKIVPYRSPPVSALMTRETGRGPE